jgi:hypothetical protein
MEIDAKKIKIVQEILSLRDDSVLSEIEAVLRGSKKEAYEKLLYPMTANELESRVEESMTDFKEGRVKSSKELLKKYGK